MVLEVCADFVFISVVAYSKVTLTGNTEVSIFDAQHSALNWPQLLMTACGATSTENNIIMYIYHALINALSAHMLPINLRTLRPTSSNSRHLGICPEGGPAGIYCRPEALFICAPMSRKRSWCINLHMQQERHVPNKGHCELAD